MNADQNGEQTTEEEYTADYEENQQDGRQPGVVFFRSARIRVNPRLILSFKQL